MTRPNVSFRTGVEVGGKDLSELLSCAYLDLYEASTGLALMGLGEEAERCSSLARSALELGVDVKDRTEVAE